MRGNAVTKGMRPLFLKMRDGYLDMIFKRNPRDTSYPGTIEQICCQAEIFAQKRRNQWPKDMEVILQRLFADRESFRSH